MREFNLKDEKFKDMQMALNAAIVQVGEKIAKGEFEQGDVSLKLKIGTVIEQKDETVYKMPAFTYKIGTNLQKKSNMDGGDAYRDMELKVYDDMVILERVKSDQIDMFNEED